MNTWLGYTRIPERYCAFLGNRHWWTEPIENHLGVLLGLRINFSSSFLSLWFYYIFVFYAVPQFCQDATHLVVAVPQTGHRASRHGSREKTKEREAYHWDKMENILMPRVAALS